MTTGIAICFNCRHWDEEKITASNHRYCEHPKNSGVDDEEEDGCSMQIDLGIEEAKFCTGPKFGCIHFEA